LDGVGSRHLRVVFDPVNLLSVENFRTQAQVVVEGLELLGGDIAVMHAKDFVPEWGGLRTVPAGRGELDYAPVMRFIRERAPDMQVLLEEAGPAVAGECASFLQRKFEEFL
jgi:sugar phosphate isomerase/epimerase